MAAGQLNAAQVIAVLDECRAWAVKCMDWEKEAQAAAPATINAYNIIHQDMLWRLRRKLGALWFGLPEVDLNEAPQD